MSRRLFNISLIIGWIGVTISPLFDFVVVTEDYDLTKHRLGFPLPIIEQHNWFTPLESAFPYKLGLANPQEHPTKLLFMNYLLSIAMVTLSIYLLMIIIKLIIKKAKKVS